MKKTAGKKTSLQIVNAQSPAAPSPAIRTITIAGVQYTLDFTYNALALAERAFNVAGAKTEPPYRISLLVAYADRGSLLSSQTIFACALYTHHPDIDYRDACAMVDMPTAYAVAAEYLEYLLRKTEAEAQPKDAA